MPEEPSIHQQVFGTPEPDVDTVFARVSAERVVDGLWARPGLAIRDRRLLTLAVLAAGSNDRALEAHLDGALHSGDLSVTELEEASVHLAHYAGWPVGSRLAAAVADAVSRSRTSWPIERPIGVVGVGALGGDVAAELVGRGASVIVHDVRHEVAEGIDGAVAVRDLGALGAACDVISIVVRDGTQVIEVVTTLAATAQPGTVLLVHSTVSVDVIEHTEAIARAAGLALLDVGLCRPAGLDSGLVALVGGDEEAATHVAPVLGAIARRGVHLLGPLGSGMIVKALRNAVLYGAYAAVSEAVDVCRMVGVDIDELLDALRDSGASGSAGLAFVAYRNDWTAGEGAGLEERRGFVELARKDLGVAAEVATTAGVPASFTAAIADAMPAAYLVEPASTTAPPQ